VGVRGLLRKKLAPGEGRTDETTFGRRTDRRYLLQDAQGRTAEFSELENVQE